MSSRPIRRELDDSRDGRASPVSSVGGSSVGAASSVALGAAASAAAGEGGGRRQAKSLLAAVQGGSLEDVRECIAAGANVNFIHPARKQNLVFFAASRPSSREADAHGGLLGRGGRRGLMELLVEEYGLKAAALDINSQTPLFYAIREGDVDACAYLIRQRCDPDQTDYLHQSPLFYAASRGHTECVDMLLAQRCEHERVDENGQTPLFWAASRGCIESMLRARCDVNRRDALGDTPVFFAVQSARGKTASHSGAVERIRLLVSHRADVQLANNKGETCLFVAAKCGLPEMCRLLTDEMRLDPGRCDRTGSTALQVAKNPLTAAELQKAVCKLAAERTVGENREVEGLAAKLYIAVQSGTLEETASLLKAKAQPSSVVVTGGENLGFHAAARESGALDMLQLLVARKLDPTVVNTRLHQTPLFFAVRPGPRAGGLECAKYLMQLRCQPNHSDLRGETPLFYAVQREEPHCAEALMAAGAKASHKNNYGATAVFYAARAGADASMKALLVRGAPADACDNIRQTALWEVGSTGCTQLLLQSRCDPNQRNKAGQTAFMAAAERGADDVLRTMISGGSSSSRSTLVREADSSGRTCLFYAAMFGHARTCQLLLESRADPLHADMRSSKAVDVARQFPKVAALLRAAEERSGAVPGANKRAAGPRSEEQGDPAEVILCSSGSEATSGGSPCGGPPRKLSRRRCSLTFQDQSGRVLPPHSQEYSAALQRLVGACPWLDGWKR